MFVLSRWCPEPESNRHAPVTEAADFKSAVSTNFTIGALVAHRICTATGYSLNHPQAMPGNAAQNHRFAQRQKGSRSFPFLNWSGKRVSNSRPQPWQGCALPTELFPHGAYLICFTNRGWQARYCNAFFCISQKICLCFRFQGLLFWRRGPESNRTNRICNPGHNRFATAPQTYDKKGKSKPSLF